MFTPVIDISTHQPKVDFSVTRASGVAGVIIRATHGTTIDQRLAQHVADARAGGYADSEIGFYTFINPKRGTGPDDCARATIKAIRDVFGHTDTFYMLDIEDYANENPERGVAPLFGPAFATYIRDHIAAVRAIAPEIRILAYSNHAYWAGAVPGRPNARWVDDTDLAASLDWIVPRYHVWPTAETQKSEVSLRAWQMKNAPPEPAGWADWALTVRPKVKGPITPNGVPWAGWQFSAGFNGQGARYGIIGGGAGNRPPDLDLNIVRTDAWLRWTNAKAAPVDKPDPVGPKPFSGGAPDKTTAVQAGEGWFAIARRVFGDASRWREIADLNGGQDRVLHPGDELRLP